MKLNVPCGVPWCVAVAEPSEQYCVVHQTASTRAFAPPAVKVELQKRYEEETRLSPSR